MAARPRTLARLRGWAAAAHPFPIAMVLTLTALVGITSTDGSFDVERLALVLVAMLLSQLAIGWTNDYLDREKDRIHQPTKPIAAGLVEARLLPPVVALVLAGVTVSGALLGLVPLLLLAAGTLAGLAYDFGVKDTRLSWLPYVVAFALLPAFVWLSLDAWRPELAWLYPIGAPLTVAVHVANALPDLTDDATAGRRGIAVALGRRTALRLLTVCLATPVVITAASLLWLSYDGAIIAATGAAYVLLLVLAWFTYHATSFEEGARRAFRLIAPACVIFAAGWLAAV